MRKTEQRLWDRMRKALGAKLVLERMENVAAVGTPDVMAGCRGRITPVELKAVDAYPVRSATRVLGAAGLSVDQRNWHLRWHQQGCFTLVLVGVGSHDLYALPGALHDEINDMNAGDLAHHALARDWRQLFVVLGGKE